MPVLQNVNSGSGVSKRRQWQPKVKKSSTTHCEVSFTFRNIIPFGFRSHKVGLLKLPKPCISRVHFATLVLRQQPKAERGYLYDNIVCNLKVILENFYNEKKTAF